MKALRRRCGRRSESQEQRHGDEEEEDESFDLGIEEGMPAMGKSAAVPAAGPAAVLGIGMGRRRLHA